MTRSAPGAPGPLPAHNADVAAAFEITDRRELEEANPFRVRAYRNAGCAVRDLGRDVGGLVKADEDLTD